MTSDSKLFPPRPAWEAKGYKPDQYGRWIGPDGDIALPFMQGAMLHQFDFSQKGWLSGTGLRAKWRPIGWESKVLEPQFLMAAANFAEGLVQGAKPSIRRIARNTDTRMMICGLIPRLPCGDKAAIVRPRYQRWGAPLVAVLNSFAVDYVTRTRCGGTQLDYHYIAEIGLPAPASAMALSGFAMSLAAAHWCFSPDWLARTRSRPLYRHWALTVHERLRQRSICDAACLALFDLDLAGVVHILADCEHSVANVSDKAFSRTLDPKGFWRVDKDKDPELRHTVLTQIAFHDLQHMIDAHGGDRDKGIEAFCAQNDGEGWMLPETVRLADYGLGHDQRAREHQPVASRLGPRFYDWQITQSVDESWVECERHARNILGEEGFAKLQAELKGQEVAEPAKPKKGRKGQGELFKWDERKGQGDLFEDTDD